MRVIIDSNQIIHKDWFLSGAVFKELLHASHRRHIELTVPRIVLDEVTNKYREELLSVQREIRKVVREANFLRASVDSKLLDDAYVDQLAADYEAQLSRILSLYRVDIWPYPNVGHEVVARRALNRRKPFDAHGHKGYRDALLWIAVLDAAIDNEVIFISANWADFAQSKEEPNSLAGDLLQDLAAAGHGENRVTLYSSVSKFVKSWSEHADEIQRFLQERLDSNQPFRDELEMLLRSTILEQSNLRIDLEREAEGEVVEVLPEEVYTFYILEVRSVRELTKGEYLIELFAEADVDVNITERIAPDRPRGIYRGLYADQYLGVDQYESRTITKTVDFEFDGIYRDEAFTNIQMTYPFGQYPAPSMLGR